MELVRFNFLDGGTTMARVLKYWTEGDFSHASVTLDGVTYESNGHEPMKNGVVRATSPMINHKHGKNLTILTLNVSKERFEAVKLFLDGCVGDKYDYAGAANFVSRQIMSKPNKWYCSELAAVAFYLLIGETLQGKQLISPQRLYDQIYFYKKDRI
jgi:uncharacterized protein YycO